MRTLLLLLLSNYILSQDLVVNYENSCVDDRVYFSFFYEDSIKNVLWDFGDGNISKRELTTNLYKEHGIYEVNLEVINSKDDTLNHKGNIEIYSLPNPKIEIDNPESCEEHILNISTDSIYLNYTWILNNRFIGDSHKEKVVIDNLKNESKYSTIKLIVTDTNNCRNFNKLEEVIKTYKKPKANYELIYDSIYLNNEVFLENISDNYNSHKWYLEDHGLFTTYDLNIKLSDVPNIYDVMLIVENGNRCFDTISGHLNIRHTLFFYIPYEYYLNENYVFKAIFINGFDEEDYVFKIFNSKGELYFETNDYTEGWNGKYKEVYVKDGYYIYLIEYYIKSLNYKRFEIGHFKVRN